MNNAHSALIDITKRRPNRTPKCVTGKTDKHVADELFTGHQDARVDFTADYDSPYAVPIEFVRHVELIMTLGQIFVILE
jgi:hypothetical protein